MPNSSSRRPPPPHSDGGRCDDHDRAASCQLCERADQSDCRPRTPESLIPTFEGTDQRDWLVVAWILRAIELRRPLGLPTRTRALRHGNIIESRATTSQDSDLLIATIPLGSGRSAFVTTGPWLGKLSIGLSILWAAIGSRPRSASNHDESREARREERHQDEEPSNGGGHP